jgi:hypothetical protein
LVGTSFLFVDPQCNKKMRDKKMNIFLTCIRVLGIFVSLRLFNYRGEIWNEGLQQCSPFVFHKYLRRIKILFTLVVFNHK